MYKLPRTGQTLERPTRAPTYSLRATKAPTVTSSPRPLPVQNGVIRGSYGHDQLIRDRLQQQRQPRTQRASHAFTVSAPSLNLPKLATLSLMVADEATLPGIFGTIALRG